MKLGLGMSLALRKLARDSTSPTLSLVSLSDIAETTATLNFTSDEAGTYYYLVYAAADSAPNAATIKAQGVAVAKGTDTALADSNTASITGLSDNTSYKVYLIVEDSVSNISSVSTSELMTLEAYAMAMPSYTVSDGENTTTVTTGGGIGQPTVSTNVA